MIIPDTSVWIEFLKNNQNFFPKMSKLLELGEILAVECIFGELLQGVKNKKEKEIILGYWKFLPKINCENVIIEAGMYSSENKLPDYGVGLIDAVILVHSIKSNSKIWTLDKKFWGIIPDNMKYTENFI